MRERKTYVHVHLHGQFVPAGLLTVLEDGRRSTCTFQYGQRYLQRPDAVPVDPVLLPLAGAKGRTFYGPMGGELFGGIRDASPDAWGRHVLDRAAETAGIALSEFDYATLAGPDRIGALGFSSSPTVEPFSDAPEWLQGVQGGELDLADLLAAADAVDTEDALDPRFRRFLVRGSSLGGARPKAPVDFEGRRWIAKFDRKREAWPTCKIEHASMRLAGMCGIHVPDTKVVSVLGRDILLVERFDRAVMDGMLCRIPFISAVTLQGLTQEEAEHGGSYKGIADAMRRYCGAATLKDDLAELFRRMVFNICSNNSDDHLRNHGFLYLGGSWSLSPAYDVVPQPDMGPEEIRNLHLDVGPAGRRATLQNALGSHMGFGLTHGQALRIIQDVQHEFSAHWEETYRQAGVPTRILEELRDCFREAFVDMRPTHGPRETL